MTLTHLKHCNTKWCLLSCEIDTSLPLDITRESRIETLQLQDIVRHQLGIFMFKYVNRSLPNPLLSMFSYIYEVHKHNTRISSHIRPIWARLSILKKSILYVGPSVWNSLDEQLKNSKSTLIFSRLYKKHLQLSYM